MANGLEYKLSLKDLFSASMNKAREATGSMDNAVNKLQSKLIGLGATIGLSALGKEMVDTGAKFDSYKARLETMLGSQKEASKVFNQIKQDAMKTPFDVASLTEANAMLIGAGASADDARLTVMGLSNAIAATGGGSDELSRMAVNLQQIKTLGKASAMDVKQFAFAGIPIYQMLSKTTGKTVEQLREMDITYEELQRSFDVASKKGGMFFGGLEKQANSIGGKLSNLKDQFTNFLVDMYDRLKPVISQVISMLSKLLSWASRNKELIIMFGKMVLLIGGIVAAMKIWTVVTGALTVAQTALNLAMTLNPIGIVIAAIAALVVAIGGLIFNYQRLKQEYMDDLHNRNKTAIDDETKSVNTLADRYLKLGLAKNKSKAYDLAKEQELKSLSLKESDIKNQIKGTVYGSDRQLALKKQLTDVSYARTALLDPSTKSDYLKKQDISKQNLKSESLSAGSSYGETVTRQNINITINKLVEKFEVVTNNMREGSAQVKEMVAKALLESVNDVNLIRQ